MSAFHFTTQKQLRKTFWEYFPELSKKKFKEFSSHGSHYSTYYCTDTRCTWVDWIDMLSRDGTISEKLAGRATL